MEAQTTRPRSVLKCPECSHKIADKSGFRYLQNDVSIQRFKCKKCGYRFSDPTALNVKDTDRTTSQISAFKVKNLASAQKTKICAGNERIPQETRGLLVKFIAYLEREGFYEGTSYYYLISSLATDGANLLDPEDVKSKIAQHTYKFKNGREGKWKDSTKALTVQAYDLFCRMQGLDWIKPHYKGKETELVISDEKDLDGLIASSQSKRMTAFLQCLKETYCDPGEILALEWQEIKSNIITIAHPVKGHYTGKYEVSGRLIALLNRLPRKDKRVFPTKYSTMMMCLNSLKKKAARKQQNPAILAITFKSFRHFGGSMIAHYTNGNVLKVKAALRHKSILNTMKYIHTIQNLREDDFEETTATTPEEIRQLGKAGWTKYDEATFNSVTMHFYRKPKRFGVN
jgi:integrase